MTTIGWLQILVFARGGARAHEAAWARSCTGLRRRAPAARALLRPDRAAALPPLRCRPERSEQTWTEYTIALLVFSAFGVLVTYAIQRLQAVLPFNPQALRRRRPGARLQHRGQLHHEHQLAVVRRRDDDELPVPDGRTHLAQLRVGGCRARRGARAGARSDPPHPRRRTEDARELLGRPHSRDSLSAAPASVVYRARAGGRRRDPEPVALSPGHHPRGRQAALALGPGRVADRDQAARHERRRLLQRQLRAPVRERDPDHQLHRVSRDPRAARGADLHVRSHGAQYQAGLGAARRDVHHVLHGDARLLLGGGARQPDRGVARCEPAARQHGGQGDALRRRELDACGPSPRPTPRTAR